LLLLFVHAPPNLTAYRLSPPVRDGRNNFWNNWASHTNDGQKNYNKKNLKGTTMKKLTLIFAAALFISLTAANAQSPTQDTTKNRRSTQENPQRSSSDQMNRSKSSSTNSSTNKSGTSGTSTSGSSQSGTSQSGSGQYDDRTMMQSSEAPASLRQSLQSSDYTGWENGHLYKLKEGGYLLEIKENGMTKTHRFDANGKPVKDKE
jgi:hypothetical protein